MLFFFKTFSCEGGKGLNDFKFGTFICSFPSDSAASMAVKRLNLPLVVRLYFRERERERQRQRETVQRQTDRDRERITKVQARLGFRNCIPKFRPSEGFVKEPQTALF